MMGVGSWSNGWDAEVRSDGDGGERFFVRGKFAQRSSWSVASRSTSQEVQF